jgi:hypothetical protein
VWLSFQVGRSTSDFWKTNEHATSRSLWPTTQVPEDEAGDDSSAHPDRTA